MLVYGDAQFHCTSSEFLRELSRMAAVSAAPTLPLLRQLLIRAGQLEQGLEDHFDAEPKSHGVLRFRASRVTDAFARVFLASYCGESSEKWWIKARMALNRCASTPQDVPLVVKVPEGFEFYAVFPEAYVASAEKWHTQRAEKKNRRALIAGVRSSGTSLSAVVAVTLRIKGWRATRCTVRPHGHPFERKATLVPDATVVPALVVDEGPGFSGSAIGAVVLKLEDSGFDDVTLLPAHNGEPGSAAPVAVRKVWERLPRIVTSASQVKWGGKELWEVLLAPVPGYGPFTTINEVSSGAWRGHAFKNESQWPPWSGQFERAKFLCKDEQGKGVLWKFSGLGAATGGFSSGSLRHHKDESGSDECWLPVIGARLGFTATPWVEGERLKPSAIARPEVMRSVVDYAVMSFHAPLDAQEHKRGVRRLEEMAYWNLREAFGDEAGKKARRWAAAAAEMAPQCRYTDGRMAPHEWVQTPKGRLIKTGGLRGALDYTVVGRQCFAWDVAGMLLEWRMEEQTQKAVFHQFTLAGLQLSVDCLKFFVLAYAAFRMGMMTLVSAQSSGAERDRVEAERSYYRRMLQML